MDTATTLIRREAERFAELLSSTDADRPVPTCGEWTASDLLWHLTEVHEFWSGILSSGATSVEEVEAIDEKAAPRPEGIEEVLRRREAATALLTETLDARADDEPAWSWFETDQSVGFTRRMQTQEATVHRVDAELTAGARVTTPDPDVAAAGLTHCVEVMWPAVRQWVPDWAGIEDLTVLDIEPLGADHRRIEIARATGTSPRTGNAYSTMLARPLAPETHAPDLPRATAQGSVVALYLWSWGRSAALEALDSGAQSVELSGDDDALAAVEALLEQGLQ